MDACTSNNTSNEETYGISQRSRLSDTLAYEFDQTTRSEHGEAPADILLFLNDTHGRQRASENDHGRNYSFKKTRSTLKNATKKLIATNRLAQEAHTAGAMHHHHGAAAGSGVQLKEGGEAGPHRVEDDDPEWYRYNETEKDYSRIHLTNQLKYINPEWVEACKLIKKAIELRQKYDFNAKRDVSYLQAVPPIDPRNPFDLSKVPHNRTGHSFEMKDGVVLVRHSTSRNEKDVYGDLPTLAEFIADYEAIDRIACSGPVKSMSYRRLKVLEKSFEIHLLLNEDLEQQAQLEMQARSSNAVDFSTVHKVDTHIHLAAAMTAEQLLLFMKDKFANHGDEVVICKNGKEYTLKEVGAQCGITAQSLTIDILDVKADKNLFNRFDRFNKKYNPVGSSDLRTVFLKSDNYLNGKYFAELTSILLAGLEKSPKNICTELRVSIYGHNANEWTKLAKWVVNNTLYSSKNRWLVQFPRIYDVFRSIDTLHNFEEMLSNIFLPLFQVTENPASDPELYTFLQHVSGFDSVDDESKLEGPLTAVSPKDWTSKENPSYAYYCYHLWANITKLNKLRKERHLNLFTFRPHCGESGNVDHLAAGFLLADGVNHGINLRKSPALEYLYYLTQIGIAVSPLSNNSLFLDYQRNPFPSFFKRGLNVSLSTDDPLQFHMTAEPLMEEYSVCSQVWKLSDVDMSEIARNSVYQSGFDHHDKMRMLGGKYFLTDPSGNNVHYSNVPNIRVGYRFEKLLAERNYVNALAAHN